MIARLVAAFVAVLIWLPLPASAQGADEAFAKLAAARTGTFTRVPCKADGGGNCTRIALLFDDAAADLCLTGAIAANRYRDRSGRPIFGVEVIVRMNVPTANSHQFYAAIVRTRAERADRICLPRHIQVGDRTVDMAIVTDIGALEEAEGVAHDTARLDLCDSEFASTRDGDCGGGPDDSVISQFANWVFGSDSTSVLDVTIIAQMGTAPVYLRSQRIGDTVFHGLIAPNALQQVSITEGGRSKAVSTCGRRVTRQGNLILTC